MAQLVTSPEEVAGPSAARRIGSGGVGFFRLMLHNKVGFVGFVGFVAIVLMAFIGKPASDAGR